MIKNIIFDFGGVLLHLDFCRSYAAFERLGFSNFEEMFAQHNANDLFQQLETGAISPEKFYAQLQCIVPGPVTASQLQDAWNAMLVGYRKSSLDFLTKIKAQYNLFLLSNTNEIHYEQFANVLLRETSYDNLEDFFIKTWYSHRIHRRKPDLATYQFVLQDAGIRADETLFIDDSYSNLPNAEAAGIRTHLLLPEQRIESLGL